MSIAQYHAELVLDVRTDLGEGPLWDGRARCLRFVDIVAGHIQRFDPATRTLRTLAAGGMVGCVAPRASGGLVAARADGLCAIDDAPAGPPRFLLAPAEHDATRCRFNDGKCDPQGRLWAGTMGLQGERGAGALYCFPSAGEARCVLRDVSISNGLAWSLDGATLYYIDSPTRRVDAFDFDAANATLHNRRPAVVLPPGPDVPDGCTLDAEGMLWVAHWDGGCVSRWDPRRGIQLATVAVPAPRVTSCCFGGPALEVLYITTARRGLDAAQLAQCPAAGGVFAVEAGTIGLPAVAWRG